MFLAPIFLLEDGLYGPEQVVYNGEKRDAISDMLKTLSKNEETALRMYYGLDGPKESLQELKEKSSEKLITEAEKLGIENASTLRRQEIILFIEIFSVPPSQCKKISNNFG